MPESTGWATKLRCLEQARVAANEQRAGRTVVGLRILPPGSAPSATARDLLRARCRWLERSNMAVAAATGVMYLEASGVHVEPTREDALAVRDLLSDPACTSGRFAALLRAWPVPS